MEEYFICHSWSPELQLVAEGLISKIHNVVPELTVLFMGAAALRLPGKNDVDLDILCSGQDLQRYTQTLQPVLGKPQRLSEAMAIWEYEYKGFEIDAILSDPRAPGSHVPIQLSQFEKLTASPELREQYRQLKLACNGLPYQEYEAYKTAFFKKLLT